MSVSGGELERILEDNIVSREAKLCIRRLFDFMVISHYILILTIRHHGIVDIILRIKLLINFDFANPISRDHRYMILPY